MRCLAAALVLITIAAGILGNWIADALNAVISAAILQVLT